MARSKAPPLKDLTGSNLSWPQTLDEARALQGLLARRVRLSLLRGAVRFVGGADASCAEDCTFGVIAVLDLRHLDLVDCSHSVLHTGFPYIPGYLSFREGPALLEAYRGLKIRPDVLICDGQGIAHPRGLGLASHLGVLLGIPSIGCAKSRLVGEHNEPPRYRGGWSPLLLDGRQVGAVLRTRTGVRPLYVSPGHRITLEECLDLVLASLKGYRLPEPLRQADSISRRLKTSRCHCPA